jgi:multiple sugar transport system substrate-binding protein
MDKRILYLVAAALLFCAALIAAEGGQEKAARVTLTVAGRDGAYGDAMQLAADQYSSRNPNVSFEILKLNGASLLEKTVVELSSGTGIYDLIMIDDPNAPRMMRAGWLANLDELYRSHGATLDKDLIANVVKLGRQPYSDSGTLYALPHVGNVELFAYRKDLLDKYGYRELAKWDQVLQAAQKIAAGEPGVTPILFRGTKGNPIVSGFLPIYWAFGAEILDNDRPAFTSPQARNALDFFLRLAQYAPEGVSMYQSAQVRDALYAGTGAIAIEVWPGWIGGLENPEQSKVVGKVRVTTHPGEVEPSSSLIGVWLLGIPADSKQKDAAFDYLTFITSAEIQTLIARQTGIPPTRESVHKIQELVQKYPWYPPELDGLLGGVARPRTDYWSEIEANLGTNLQLALIGDMSAGQALQATQERVQEIVSK